MTIASNISVNNPLACDALFPFSVQYQSNTMCGMGACDIYMRLWVSAMQPFLYSSGQAILTRSANGDLVSATAASFQLFQDGVGTIGTAENYWYALTAEETNVSSDATDPIGSRDIAWFGVAAGCHLGQACQRDGVGASSATDGRFVPPFLAPTKQYAAEIKDAVSAGYALSLTFSNTGVSYALGPLAHLPDGAGGATGGAMVKNGVINSPGDFMPFPIALLMGSSSTTQKVNATCMYGQQLTIGQDATSPTTGTNTAGEALFVTSVFQPVKLMILGHMVCYPYALICGVPSMIDQAAIARINAQTNPALGAR